jgi:phosphoglycolate phosphatase
MIGSLDAVFFDIDGVLIDSLPQHLKICRDKAREYGLALRIPTVDEFRAMIRGGAKVSPMLDFFRTVGFPDDLAVRAVADYERDFMALYRPRPFAGVGDMLRGLRRAGLELGLVTANTRGNVVPALGKAMGAFNPACLFFFDDGETPRSKASCLTEGARRLGVARAACLYVGDQPADAAAAAAAGFQFLGVTYGWGFAREDPSEPMADSPADIPRLLLDVSGQARDAAPGAPRRIAL